MANTKLINYSLQHSPANRLTAFFISQNGTLTDP